MHSKILSQREQSRSAGVTLDTISSTSSSPRIKIMHMRFNTTITAGTSLTLIAAGSFGSPLPTNDGGESYYWRLCQWNANTGKKRPHCRRSGDHTTQIRTTPTSRRGLSPSSREKAHILQQLVEHHFKLERRLLIAITAHHCRRLHRLGTTQ